MGHESAAGRLHPATVPSLCFEASPNDVIARPFADAPGFPPLVLKREVRMTQSLLRSIAVLAALALAACTGEDAQTDQRGIDKDITATHDAGAPTLNNIGQNNFAPWRLNMAP
jgi:hypothetical protein